MTQKVMAPRFFSSEHPEGLFSRRTNSFALKLCKEGAAGAYFPLVIHPEVPKLYSPTPGFRPFYIFSLAIKGCKA
jgi:hypothetical protein